MLDRSPQNSIHQLGEVFGLVDQDILLKDWQPPKLVVMGSTHTGKTSTAERLGMVQYSLNDEGISLPVYIILRNGPELRGTTICLHNTCTNKVEAGPYDVSEFDARDGMRKILDSLKGKEDEILGQRIINIVSEGPNLPDFIIVDTPGLQATSPLREQTRAFLQKHIDSHRSHSWFMAVIPAAERPANSLVMEVIQTNNLESRTLGIFTNVDKVTSDTLHQLRALVMQQPCAQNLGMVRLEPLGWHATMSAPPNPDVRGLERWCQQTSAENDFFVSHLSDLVEAGKAGWPSLIDVLKAEYFTFLKGSWAAPVIRRLCAEHAKAEEDSADLGLPVFDSATEENATAARCSASKVASDALKAAADSDLNRKLSLQVLEPLKAALSKVLAIDETVAFEMLSGTLIAFKESVREANRLATITWYNLCVDHATQKLMARASQLPFRLDRFPAFCNMMKTKVETAFSQKRDSIVSTFDSIITKELNALNPGCATSLRFAVNHENATVSVKCNWEALVNRILVLFIMPKSVLIELADKSAAFAEELKPASWVEACQDERKVVKDKMAHLQQAKAELMKVLGIRDAFDEIFKMRGVDPFGCDDHKTAFVLQPSELDKKIAQAISGNPFKCLVHHSGHTWFKSIPLPTRCGPQLRPLSSSDAYFYGKAIDWERLTFFLRGVCVRGCDDDASDLVISQREVHTKVKELIEGHPLKCAVYFESTGKLYIKTIALNDGGLALQQCEGAVTFLNGEPWKPEQ